MTNNYKATALLIAGWGLYLFCLLLPAIHTNDNSYTGYMAAYFAFKVMFEYQIDIMRFQYSASAIGDILSLFIVLSVGVDNRKHLKVFGITFFLLGVISLIYMFQYRFNSLGSGYFTWVISLFMIAYAHILGCKKT